MMFDAACKFDIPGLAPWFGLLVSWYVAIQIIGRLTAEILFFVARICGHCDSVVCKYIGKTSWELGRMFAAIGWGTPRRYMHAYMIAWRLGGKRWRSGR